MFFKNLLENFHDINTDKVTKDTCITFLSCDTIDTNNTMGGINMDKIEYINMNTKERVNYLNQELQAGKTLEVICTELEIRKSNLTVPLKNHGYEFLNGKFVLQEIQEVSKESNENPLESNVKQLEESILIIAERVNQIEKKMIQKIQEDTIPINLPEGDEGMMSSRVNNEVMRQWRDFTSTRREKAKDLFSMALWEFMINHR